MKKIILVFALAPLSLFAQTIRLERHGNRTVMVVQDDSANVKTLQGIIEFDPAVKDSCTEVIREWYVAARSEGKTYEKAFRHTLDKMRRAVR